MWIKRSDEAKKCTIKNEIVDKKYHLIANNKNILKNKKNSETTMLLC